MCGRVDRGTTVVHTALLAQVAREVGHKAHNRDRHCMAVFNRTYHTKLHRTGSPRMFLVLLHMYMYMYRFPP